MICHKERMEPVCMYWIKNLLDKVTYCRDISWRFWVLLRKWHKFSLPSIISYHIFRFLTILLIMVESWWVSIMYIVLSSISMFRFEILNNSVRLHSFLLVHVMILILKIRQVTETIQNVRRQKQASYYVEASTFDQLYKLL